MDLCDFHLISPQTQRKRIDNELEEKKCGNSKAKQGTYRGLSPLSSWSYMGVGEVEA